MENKLEQNPEVASEKKQWIKPEMQEVIDIDSFGGGGLESATGGS